MKKKQYIVPEVEIIELDTMQPMLAGSINILIYNKEGDEEIEDLLQIIWLESSQYKASGPFCFQEVPGVFDALNALFPVKVWIIVIFKLPLRHECKTSYHL